MSIPTHEDVGSTQFLLLQDLWRLASSESTKGESRMESYMMVHDPQSGILHCCHMPLVRNKSQVLLCDSELGITQRHKYWEARIVGTTLGSVCHHCLLSPVFMGLTRATDTQPLPRFPRFSSLHNSSEFKMSLSKSGQSSEKVPGIITRFSSWDTISANLWSYETNEKSYLLPTH